MDNPFILSLDGPRANITINRPEKRNALDIADLERLDALIGELQDREDLRVLVLTAAGGKAFCAGVDLSDVSAFDWRDNPLERVCERIADLPLATVCALNGGVFGGGVDLAQACDFRIGVKGMKLFIPPVKIGVHYHLSGMRRSLACFGPNIARRLYLGAETLTDEDLLALGFLNALVAAEELPAATDALADRLAGLAPLAYRGMKATLNDLLAGRADPETVAGRIGTCFTSEDMSEGLAAMKEKRPPRFKGR